MTEEAFRWVAYTPAAATVDLVSAGPGGQGNTVRASPRSRSSGTAGDWKVIAPPGGDWGNAATELSSLAGYTIFPGQEVIADVCPVLIDPACMIGKVVGAVAGAAAAGALNGIASAIQSGVAWMVTNSIDLVGAGPVPGPGRRTRRRPAPAVDPPARRRRRRARRDHRGRPDGPDPQGEPADRRRVGAGDHRRDLRRRRAAAVAAAEGGGRLVVLGAAGLDRRPVRRPADQRADAGGASPAVVVVLGIVAIVISAIQAVLMLFRQGALVILAGVLPLAAAGTLTPATRPWFRASPAGCSP